MTDANHREHEAMSSASTSHLAMAALVVCGVLWGCGGADRAPSDGIDTADGDARVETNRASDVMAPTITIVSTAGPDDSGRLAVSGVATDNRRVARIRWHSSSGERGLATIDNSNGNRNVGWAASIPTRVGQNVIRAVAVDGAGNTASAETTITVDGTTSTPPPSVTLSADPTTVASGSTTTLSWSAANATSCTASGGWSGTLVTSGSVQSAALAAPSTVFNLQCDGSGGSGTASVTVAATGGAGGGDAGTITGLDFPSNGQTSQDVRFRFMGSSLPPMYPATYIWRVKVRQQSGYYTTFFWGQSDGAFIADSYYGAHPYPDNGLETGRTHKWELSIRGVDVTEDANGNSTQLGYDQWRTQALRVFDDGTVKRHEFYWDLSDTSKVIRHSVDRSYGVSPPFTPALTFGDAPWSVGKERLSGILRGIQIYSGALSLNDIVAEASVPMSSSAGKSNIWYLNINPTPSDISDKSGRGHNPSWVGTGRAALWTGP